MSGWLWGKSKVQLRVATGELQSKNNGDDWVTVCPTSDFASPHSHTESEITGLVADLAAKAPSSHTHAIANVTGLQSALDAKEPLIQRAKLTTNAAGAVTWTYPIAFGAGVVPIIEAVVQAANGVTDVINVQLDGAPTNTSVTLRVTRTQLSLVALIGLTILSIPASVGAQIVHVTARAP